MELDFDDAITSKKDEVPLFKPTKCLYPMPEWTDGICGCKFHVASEHEAIEERCRLANIEAKERLKAKWGHDIDERTKNTKTIVHIRPNLWNRMDVLAIEEVKINGPSK